MSCRRVPTRFWKMCCKNTCLDLKKKMNCIKTFCMNCLFCIFYYYYYIFHFIFFQECGFPPPLPVSLFPFPTHTIFSPPLIIIVVQTFSNSLMSNILLCNASWHFSSRPTVQKLVLYCQGIFNNFIWSCHFIKCPLYIY